MNMAAAVRRLNFSQNFINVQAFSCLPGCLLSSEILHLLDNAVVKCEPRKISRSCYIALLRVEGHCRFWTEKGCMKRDFSDPRSHDACAIVVVWKNTASVICLFSETIISDADWPC